MRPGMQCLLQLLRGQTIERGIDDAEWEAALALAAEEHVLPSAAARLRQQQASISPAILDRVSVVERGAAVAAFYWSSELRGLLRAFDQEGLVAVPLKGPFFAERLYGSTALRVSQDLDLLVPKAELVRAEAVLTAIGFIPGTPDDYHRQWYRGTTTVELHHDVENPLAYNFHVESALRQARQTAFHGEHCWQLAPEDELLFLCLHAVRHRFERLSLVLDLTLAFEQLTVPGDEWRPRQEVAELTNLLILGLAMARRLRPENNLAIPFPASQESLQHLENLADRLWDRLLTQSSEPLDWAAVHEFYLEIELPGRQRLHCRWRHFNILIDRVIDRDYTFAAGLGFHRAWQVRLLRPVRLLNDLIRH